MNFLRMHRRSCSVLLGCGVLLFFMAATEVLAKKKKGEDLPDYLCRTTVEYDWKRQIAPTDKDEKRKGKPPVQPMDETHTVAFRTLESKAKSDKEAKELLETQLVVVKEKAAEHCRLNHENLSACVAAKYDSLQTVLSRLDFNARSALQVSVQRDCEMQLGRCEAVKNQEPKCFIPGPPSEEEAEKAAGKK